MKGAAQGQVLPDEAGPNTSGATPFKSQTEDNTVQVLYLSNLSLIVLLKKY